MSIQVKLAAFYFCALVTNGLIDILCYPSVEFFPLLSEKFLCHFQDGREPSVQRGRGGGLLQRRGRDGSRLHSQGRQGVPTVVGHCQPPGTGFRIGQTDDELGKLHWLFQLCTFLQS